MMSYIDYVLDRITMYRLLLYVLIAYIGVAAVLAYDKLLPFTPFWLLVSTVFLVVVCWAANTIFSYTFKVPTNIESGPITALILALIITPAQSFTSFQFLGWAAILAMASKYILVIRRKHLFNPAAIAVVITLFAVGDSASWWVGTLSMLPVVCIGGFLVARKSRQDIMVYAFCLTVFICVTVISLAQNQVVIVGLNQTFIESPLFFFAFIMLTEPLTAPTTHLFKIFYAVLIGILFLPQVHIGSLYLTPEIALVVGNVFAYLVSPKQKVLLRLQRKIQLSPYIMDFLFKPTQKLAFQPGQYMEFTLAHDRTDSRGNRRYFTLASSPTESNVRLGVRFYDKGSSYKNSLADINKNTEIIASQIAGDFTLPSNPRQKLVFIAGGIGITPFRSMLKYLIDKQEWRDIAMFYVNKTADEVVYNDVLRAAHARLGVRVFYTLTDMALIPAKWQGFTGRIDEQKMLYAVPDYDERIFYISGPPGMVNDVERMLKNMGVKREHIKKDFFPGLV